MAHQPATIDGAPASAYQAASPFNWVGTKIAPNTSLTEALAAAKLDHHVRLEDMFIRNNPDVTPSQLVPRRKAVVRNGDNRVLGTVGDKYKILQYPDAFGVLEHGIRDFGITIESAGAIGKGEKAWVLAKLPSEIEVTDGDKVGGYFLLYSGHDGATPYIASLVPWRFYCTNAIMMSLRSGSNVFRMSHVRDNSEQLDIVANMVKDLVHSLKVTGETFRTLAQRRLNRAEVEDFVNKVLRIETAVVTGVAERRRDSILELVWSGKGAREAGSKEDRSETTAWAAFNAVTEYVDHVRPAEGRNPRAVLRANESALFGSNALLKVRALNLAEEFAVAA